MNYYFEWEELLKGTNLFFEKYKITPQEQDFFFQSFLPVLNNYIKNQEPIFNTFQKEDEGKRKEVYCFPEFVIKLTSCQEVEEENARKIRTSFKEESFLDNFIFILPTTINAAYNTQLTIEHINCFILQVRARTIPIDVIYTRKFNKRMIINKDWLYSFIKENYPNYEASVIIQFLENIDFTSWNAAYDMNNKPVLIDW